MRSKVSLCLISRDTYFDVRIFENPFNEEATRFKSVEHTLSKVFALYLSHPFST